MLRIIIRTDNANVAANVGGSVETTWRTFDVSLPEVERALRDEHQLAHTQVVGVELIDPVEGVRPEAPGDLPF